MWTPIITQRLPYSQIENLPAPNKINEMIEVLTTPMTDIAHIPEVIISGREDLQITNDCMFVGDLGMPMI